MCYEIHELVRERLQEETVPMARDIARDFVVAKIVWGVVFGLLPHFFVILEYAFRQHLLFPIHHG